MGFTDMVKLEEEGHKFDCKTCKEFVKSVRRCKEDREDFTEKDNQKGKPQIWPIRLNKGGTLFGFCPAKATWDPVANEIFRLLVIATETGVMLEAGGINDQPDWFVENLGWFAPKYRETVFGSRARSLLGDGKNKQALTNMVMPQGPTEVQRQTKGSKRGRNR